MVIGDPGAYTGSGLLDPVPHVTPAGGLEKLYILVDTAGEVADSLPPVDLGPVARLRGLPVSLAPFIRRTISTADPRGDVWLASTDRYMLYRRTPSGDTAMTIRMEVPAAQFGPGQRDSIEAAIRGASRAVAPDEVGLGPQTIRALHPDDSGRLFVEPAVATEDRGRVFDLFDPRGRFLGRIVSDVAFAARPRVVIRGDAAYGVVLDHLDVPHLVRARLEMPGEWR